MTRFLTSLPLAALFAAAPALAADDFTPALQAYMASDIASWAADPALVAAITAQNAATGGYDQAKIDALDQEWQAAVGAGDNALVTGVLTGPAADFLRAKVADSGGKITEAFVTDAKGLNVAASDPTSDYWQGDEDKFSKTFSVGADAVFLGEVEQDESTQTYQSQVSITVVDPATGSPIGSITAGVDLSML